MIVILDPGTSRVRVDISWSPPSAGASLGHRSVSARSLEGRDLILALFEHGLLSPGQELVWRRPRSGRTYRAHPTSEGALRVEGHPTPFPSASAAATYLSGSNQNGLLAWRLAVDGRTLQELRSLLR